MGRFEYSESLLLAEDDDEVRDLLSEMLTGQGFQVTAVSSGDAASLQLASKTFDLLLTDLQMPGHLSGLDLTESAQALIPPLPVLLMTGRSDLLREPLSQQQLLLKKPFSYEHLMDGIDQLLH